MRRTNARKQQEQQEQQKQQEQQRQQQRQHLCRGDIICANVGSNIAGTTRVSRRALCKMRLAERARTRAMRATPRAGQRDAALFRHPFLLSFLSLALLSALSTSSRPVPRAAFPRPFVPVCRVVSCSRFRGFYRASPSHREIARTGFYIKNLTVYCFIAFPV